MKILLVSPIPPPASGIGSWTFNLLEYFSAMTEKFKVIHQDTALKYRNPMKNGLWNRGFLGTFETIGIIIEFRKNLKKHSPDLIHLTSSASLGLIRDFIIQKISANRKIPLVIHWHFGRIPTLAKICNWEWKLLIRLISKCQASIVIDRKSYESLKKAGFGNVINIPNPVFNGAQALAEDISRHANLRNPGSVIFAGHIIRNKGVFELVEACAGIPLVNELSMVGSCLQTIQDELMKLAYVRDEGRWLKFFGNIPTGEVLKQMLKSPVLALPSYTEGFPNVVIEAMSMGCAVVATEAGAIPEILAVASDTPCGICVPAHDVEGLRNAILHLVNNPLEAFNMGKRGRERILENYTIDKVTKQYESVWTSVVYNRVRN